MAQTPKVKKAYGKECRSLFGPTQSGWKMVGCDASGIELRMLGHRMAYYDGGEMAEIVLHGDVHAEWMKATGMFYRENQKNESYSFIYGAGDKVMGMYVLMDWREAYEKGKTKEQPPGNEFAQELGAGARSGLMDRTPGLEEFVDACHYRHKRGWIISIDGRIIRTKTEYGVVNDVLQSDAGITMKYAAIIKYNDCIARGWRHGVDFAFLLNIHDEWQDETLPEIADEYGAIAVQAIVKAGLHLKLKIPLDGEYKIGENWCETH